MMMTGSVFSHNETLHWAMAMMELLSLASRPCHRSVAMLVMQWILYKYLCYILLHYLIKFKIFLYWFFIVKIFLKYCMKVSSISVSLSCKCITLISFPYRRSAMNRFFTTHKHSWNYEYKWDQQYWNLTSCSDSSILTTKLIYKYRLQWISVQRWYQTHYLLT